MSIRKITFTAVVAFISAFTAVGVFNYMGWNKQQVSFVQKDAPAQLAAYSYSKSEVQPIDFRYAAAAATPTVVHIKSTFKPEKTSYRNNDPLQQLFGEDYRYFFQGPSPYGSQPQVATGSGVIVSPDGYIVTNNHVVENADEIEVVLNNQKSYKAKVIGRDPDVDIALIKVDDNNLPAISFGNSDSALVGEWVLAVGNPFNLESTVTAGIISAKGRNINLLGDEYGTKKTSNTSIESFIQTDAAVNPGNSGGALVNVNGELIGINTAIASPTGSYAGYSFAVPGNIVKKVIFDLQKYGVTQRGFLGVTIRTMDDQTAHDLGFNSPHGVYVDGVNKGSAAEEGGLKNKDVITDVNGVSVNSSPELQEQVAQYRPGDKITMHYIRDGKEQMATIILKNKYNTTASVETSNDILETLGVQVENLSSSDLRSLGISGGVRVTGLKDGKLTEFTDIRKGFVVTQIDDQPVNNTNDFINMLKDKSGKVLIEGIYPNKAVSYLYAFRM